MFLPNIENTKRKKKSKLELRPAWRQVIVEVVKFKFRFYCDFWKKREK